SAHCVTLPSSRALSVRCEVECWNHKSECLNHKGHKEHKGDCVSLCDLRALCGSKTAFCTVHVVHARFNILVSATRITAPMKATTIEPMSPAPGKMPSDPNPQPPMMPPSSPSTISI